MPRQHGQDRTRSAGPTTPATAALDRLGVDHRAHSYAHDPAETGYGAEAARELGVAPERIFKTLIVDTGSALAVAVVPVAGQLDLKAMAAALGVKAVQLADAADAERSTGYVVGGISPLGQRRRLTTIVDSSALDHETVYVSGGRRGIQVELSPTELLRATEGSSSPIARA